MISELHILTEAECKEIRSIVYDLKILWVYRGPEIPFYTLATASYLDAAFNNNFAYYCEMSQFYNPLLMKHLEWLYARVQQELEKHLDAPVVMHERYARPGFHIFLDHDLLRQPVASIHCDLQHLLLDWGPVDQVDLEKPLSFTLSISLPKSGAGLNVWDIHQNELLGLTPTQKQTLLHSRNCQRISYQAGGMLIHSGLSVHQIASIKDAIAGDERITLQGHAIFARGAWQIYW